MKPFTFALLLSVSFALAGCAAHNPAPTYDAGANRTLRCPDELSQPGTQVKVRMPGQDSVVLVWRTEIGLSGTDANCSHCGRELIYNAKTQTLACPSGIEYRLDGSFLRGHIPEGHPVRPLRAYVVEVEDGRLRILG